MKENGIRKKLKYALKPMGGDVVLVIATMGFAAMSLESYLLRMPEASADLLKWSEVTALSYLALTPLRYWDNKKEDQ